VRSSNDRVIYIVGVEPSELNVGSVLIGLRMASLTMLVSTLLAAFFARPTYSVVHWQLVAGRCDWSYARRGVRVRQTSTMPSSKADGAHRGRRISELLTTARSPYAVSINGPLRPLD